MNIMCFTIFTADIIISMCTTTGFGAIMGITAMYHGVFSVATAFFATPVSTTVGTTFFGFKVAVAQNTFVTVIIRIIVIAITAIRIAVIVTIIFITLCIILR